MNGMKGIDQDTLSVQIKSLIIYEFLNEYTQLEQIIRETFEQNISSLPAKVMQQLYFYNGGRIGTFIDFEEDAIKLNTVKYKEKDLFKELTINQIIKILNKNDLNSKINITIECDEDDTYDDIDGVYVSYYRDKTYIEDINILKKSIGRNC